MMKVVKLFKEREKHFIILIAQNRATFFFKVFEFQLIHQVMVLQNKPCLSLKIVGLCVKKFVTA